MQKFLRLFIFAICCIIGEIGAAVAVTCAAGKYLPANSETCTTCSGFYYCPGGTFDPSDTEQGRNPCPAKNTHTPDNFIINGFPMTVSGSSNYPLNGTKTIGGCVVSYTLTSNTVGTLINRFYYNPTTEKYDTVQWRGWHTVKPGYYFYTPNSCGAYAYYYNAAICPEGYYCPGKTAVSCNSSNREEVHTTTFGRVACPESMPNSPAGSTSINDCRGNPIKVATKQYTQDSFAPIQTALNTTVSTINTIVDTTITQATTINTLKTTKQNRPNSDCPTGWNCLLVKDINGNDNWYPIIESLEQAAQLEPGKNLLDPATIQQGTIASANGANANGNNRCRTDFYFFPANTEVTVTVKKGTPPFYAAIFRYSAPSTDSYLGTQSKTQTISTDTREGYTFKIKNDEYVRFLFLQSANFTPSDIVEAQIEKNSTATSYEPYH